MNYFNALFRKHFIVSWVVLLAALYVGGGGMIAYGLHQKKADSKVRHHQRMSSNAIEPKYTAPKITDTDSAQLINVGVYVDRIPEFSIRNVGWLVDFYVWFHWEGSLQSMDSSFQMVDGSIESITKLKATQDGDKHYELYRVLGRNTKFFDVSRYPCDDHLLTVSLESSKAPRDQLLFVPDDDNSATSSRVDIPGYHVARTNASIIEKPHSYKTKRGDSFLEASSGVTYSQIRYGMNIGRKGWGLYIKMFQALFVAVMLSFVVFFIDPTSSPRFGVGVGSLFAAVSNAYITGALVPETAVLTLADIINGIGIVTILVTIIQSTISLNIYKRDNGVEKSKRFDRVSFLIIFLGSLLLNIALPLAAFNFQL